VYTRHITGFPSISSTIKTFVAIRCCTSRCIMLRPFGISECSRSLAKGSHTYVLLCDAAIRLNIVNSYCIV
jgi:hypothetical protein